MEEEEPEYIVSARLVNGDVRIRAGRDGLVEAIELLLLHEGFEVVEVRESKTFPP